MKNHICEIKRFSYSIDFEQDYILTKSLMDFKGNSDGKDKNKNSKSEKKFNGVVEEISLIS